MLHYYSLTPMALLRAYTSRFAYTRFMLLIFSMFLLSNTLSWGQTTIYNEDMYNGTGGGNGNSIAVHETNNRFNEDDLTYSGTGDLRNNSSSAGYIGASGTWNIMLNAVDETFIMDGIDVSAYSDIVLSFGVRKGVNAETGSGLTVEYSTEGTAGPFTTVTWGTLPTGQNGWYLRSSTSIIPNDITTIRFRSTNITEWRIDDIQLVGTLAAAGCNITSAGLTALSCDDNGTDTDPSDDFITFDLNPTGADLGTDYTVSVSSGTISPSTGTYGSATTFTLQDGSAGAGDVTVTITDDTEATCTIEVEITDPGSCSTGGLSVCLDEDFSGLSLPTGWLSSATMISFTPGYADMAVNTGTLTTIAVSNPTLLTFDLSRTTNATAKNLNIEVSTTSPNSGFSVVTNYDHNNTTSGGTISCTVDLSAYINESVVYIRFNKTSGNTSPWRIDNIEVTCGTPCTPPSDPEGTITGTFTACSSTSLSYTYGTGEPLTDVVYYWQTDANGVSTANPATTALSVTTTGTYHVRAYNTDTSCWSTGTVSQAVTINTPPSITSQPANATRTIPATAVFTVAATGTPAPTYQWQVSTDGGSTWNNVTGGTGATTNSYTTVATTEAMNGYQYRCVVTNSCDSVTSNPATLTVTNTAPNNATTLTSCIGENSIVLNWTAATGGPTGYIVFVREGAIPAMTAATAGNASGYVANSDYTLANTYTTLGKAVYKGNATTATISGLTSGNTYTFKVVAYRGETATGWAPGINTSGSWNQSYTLGMPDANITGASVAPTSSVVTWTNPLPTSCYELLMVANEGSITSFVPSGDGTSYTANATYAGANSIVFKGNGTVTTINGLTDGLEYCYTIFVRNVTTNEWSDGVSICQTTGLSYCDSYGNTTYQTGIRNVTFNTINNSTIAEYNDYSDFTSMSTSVNIGESYDLSVNVNTHGNYTAVTRVWIDWNRDGTFTQGTEGYELGTATNVIDGVTSLSPLPITVPSNAVLGATRMRVSTQYDEPSTPCETGFDGEVEDYTINIVRSATAEINVKGNNISILNGFDEPYGLNNTLYDDTNIGDATAYKEFVIESLGLQALVLDGAPDLIQLTGNNPGDFEVVQQATSPVTASGGTTTFRIIFRPTATGDRTALVTIPNNDSNEDPYTFLIRGTGICVTSPVVTAYPTSGPANTVVTFTSTVNDLTGATVTYNGVNIPLLSSTSSRVEAAVPLGAANGNMELHLANGCSFLQPFDVIDFEIEDCDSGGVAYGSELIIYEIYDENWASGGYITIYNGTNAAVDLTGYRILRAGTYGGSYTTYSNLTGTLASGSLAVIGVDGSNCPYTTTGHGLIGASGFNANDGFRLVYGSTIIDDVRTPEDVGYYMKRKLDFVLTPNTTYDADEWIIQPVNRIGGNSSECLTGFGEAPVRKAPPIVDAISGIETSCDSYEITVTATEGTPSGAGLTYQWYSNAPTQIGWTALSNGTNYAGVTTATLTITNVYEVANYQFYVRVMEGGEDCYAASDAVKLALAVKTWVGTTNEWYDAANWSPVGVPTANDIVIITSSGQSPLLAGGGIPFPPMVAYAKSMVVENGATLSVPEGQNLIVEECIVNNGNIILEDTANLVQTHLGTDMNSGSGSYSQQRLVNGVQNLNYIYWTSPVAGVDISALPGSGNHRYYWNPTATNANGTQGDWIQATSGEMEKGRGYIVRYPTGNVAATFAANGIGRATPHNGAFTINIEKGTLTGIDDNWNLIGNPYPSAISADSFIFANSDEITSEANPSILGTVYLWQHQGIPNTLIDPFYEDFQINYDGDNYIAYNYTGVNPPTPQHGFDGYIASGQAFFVLMDDDYVGNTATVNFDNTVRYDAATDFYENHQFLRVATEQQESQSTATMERHRIWLDLIAPNLNATSTLVGYVTGATNDKDRLFDGYETNATGLGFYSLVSYERMGIQGRALPFVDSDTVPLGVNLIQTGTHTIAINQVDGLFADGQHIYLEDTYTNTIHNMRATPYTFHSVGGRFNDRFILRYTNSTLSIPDANLDAGLTIIELPNGHVKFSVGHNLTIQSVELFDMLGRQLYHLQGSQATEVYNVSNLSQAAYVAKVTLSNGQTVTKRAVKRK